MDPADDDRVFATTDRGFYLSTDGALDWKRIDRRRIGLMAFSDGKLVMVEADGMVSSLPRLGEVWEEVGTLPGAPAAMNSDGDGTLIAATQDGAVYESADGGGKWSVRVDAATP